MLYYEVLRYVILKVLRYVIPRVLRYVILRVPSPSTSPKVVDSEIVEKEWLNLDTSTHERVGWTSPPGSYAREVVGLLQGFSEEPDLLEVS